MTKKTQQPPPWPALNWHSDFGGTRSEVEHLEAFATALLARMPQARIELETPEPGLMYLGVQLPDGRLAEVYSTATGDRSEARRYGLFLGPGTDGERELYSESIDCIVRHFLDWQTAERV